MRVLFVYPSIGAPVGPNHGLAILSGVLKAHGHETALIHLNEALGPLPDDQQVAQMVTDYHPDLIGFSILSQQYPEAIHLAEVIRCVTDTPLVAGGVHPTLVPEEVIEDGVFDYVCVGEGEGALLELVECLQSKGDTTCIPSIWTRRGGVVIRNPVRPFQNLECLPPADYELFDLNRILRATRGWLSILTTRGCPYACTYCLNREIVARYVTDGAASGLRDYVRQYPIERTLEDIKRLKKLHSQIEVIIFDDDLFTLNASYTARLCHAYKEAGIGLPFVVNAHVHAFDDAMACNLKQAGCMIVKFGLESGNERLRKEVLGRHMTDEQIRAAFACANRHGLHTSAFVLLGLPHEGEAEILDTVDRCVEIGVGRMRWAFLYPFHGTRIYTYCERLGLIDHDRMQRMSNYFDESCLRFSTEHRLFLEKIGRAFHWWVNAHTGWPCSAMYQDLVDQLVAMPWAEWQHEKMTIFARDRALSDSLMSQGIPHYSLRYSRVMAVHSDWVLRENQGQLTDSS